MSISWLITGAGGQLGSVLLRKLTRDGEAAMGTISTGGPAPIVGRAERIDLTDFEALGRFVRTVNPRFIVHAAAVTSVDAAWQAPEGARRINVGVTAELGELSREIGCRLVFLSTDLVFDGAGAPYVETDTVSPLSVYGRTKAEAERAVLGVPNSLVLRPALMYGISAVDRPTTFRNQLEALRTGQPLRLFEDEYRTPLWLEDAAKACIETARAGLTGVLHIAGPERLSRLEMGRLMARSLGVRGDGIVATRQGDMQTPEPRPPDVSLDCGLYGRHFGHPPGRTMGEALAEMAGQFPS